MFMIRAVMLFSTIMIAHAGATALGLSSVKQPLYIQSDADAIITIADVPYVANLSWEHWKLSAICAPFTPPASSIWQTPVNANLASLYGIKVGGDQIRNTRDIEVIVDIREAKVPENYPFTITQVTDSVITCVRMMYPEKPEEQGKLIIRILKPGDEPAEPKTEGK